MLRRKPPTELGKLIDTHRPLHPAAAWALIVVVALVLTPFATNGDIPPWPVYAIIFVFLCYGEAFVFSAQFLLEHRLYEHGLVVRTMLIGTPIYVIPHCTVRADRLRGLPARAESGDDDIPHRRKCVRTRPSVRLYGLGPEHARLLGKGKLTWDQAASPNPGPLPGDKKAAPTRQDWEIDYRDAERHLELIRATVLTSQRARPYTSGWS